MKKLVVCFLSLIFVFNNFITIFAEKDNPLIENPEYCDLVRKEFKRIGDGFKTRDPACIWAKTPTNDDYREIKIFNFPYLIKDNPQRKNRNFIISSLNMFLELTEITNNMSSVIEKAGKEAGKLLRICIHKRQSKVWI